MKGFGVECKDNQINLEVPWKEQHDANKLEQAPRIIFDLYSFQPFLFNINLTDRTQDALRVSLTRPEHIQIDGIWHILHTWACEHFPSTVKGD